MIKKIFNKLRKWINSDFSKIMIFAGIVIFLYIKFISKASDPLQGAFWGVIVGLFSYIANHIYERELKRYNCMVYLEQELNVCRNELSDNKFQLQKIIESTNPTVLFPVELTLSDENIKNIGRIELKQDMYKFYVGMRKVKISLNQIVSIYERNISNFSTSQFQTSTQMQYAFQSFYSYYKEEAERLKAAIETLEEELIKCLAEVRFFLNQDRPLLNKFTKFYNVDEYKKWVPDDIERIRNEIETNSSQLVEENT